MCSKIEPLMCPHQRQSVPALLDTLPSLSLPTGPHSHRRYTPEKQPQQRNQHNQHPRASSSRPATRDSSSHQPAAPPCGGGSPDRWLRGVPAAAASVPRSIAGSIAGSRCSPRQPAPSAASYNSQTSTPRAAPFATSYGTPARQSSEVPLDAEDLEREEADGGYSLRELREDLAQQLGEMERLAQELERHMGA